MTTTSAVLALLPRYHRRVAQIPAAIRNDFADPLAAMVPWDYDSSLRISVHMVS